MLLTWFEDPGDDIGDFKPFAQADTVVDWRLTRPALIHPTAQIRGRFREFEGSVMSSF